MYIILNHEKTTLPIQDIFEEHFIFGGFHSVWGKLVWEIYIYVAYSRPNGWTDWAKILWTLDIQGWPPVLIGKKKLDFFKKHFFSV